MKYLILFITIITSFHTSAEKKKPNVIVILSDDQGYGDFSAHGNPILTTRHLDKLASESIQLTDFHVDPTCSPSRAALMTGKYATKVGVWLTFAGRNHLYKEEMTMADVFKYNGYRTAIFGKWHLGDNYPFRPQDRGFDKSFIHGGGVAGETPDYWDNDYFDDTYFDNGKPIKTKGYTTDVWFEEAKKFIDQSNKAPFFIYLAANTPHGPFNVEEKFYKPYLDQGVPEQRARFYGMIETVDNNVGNLRHYLKAKGLAENTLILYLTDNGTSMGFDGDKNGYPKSASNGFNANMRGRKTSAYEGGHRAAAFWHWPAGNLVNNKLVGENKINQLTSHIDILPTFIDQLALLTPKKVEFDGSSLTRLLTHKDHELNGRKIVVHNQARFGKPLGAGNLIKDKDYVVMQDNWRLVGDELYNLEVDPSQKNDIAKNNSDKVKALDNYYQKWWLEVSQKERLSPTIINPNYQKETVLTSQAWSGDIATYDQSHIRAGVKHRGAWYIDVEVAGNYQIEFSRWPKESHLAINDFYQKDFSNQFFDSEFALYKKPSRAINAQSLTTLLDDTVVNKHRITTKQKTVKMDMYLSQGLHKIEGVMQTEKGQYSAYYLYIKQK